jgi:hypothetical protein
MPHERDRASGDFVATIEDVKCVIRL